jgi:Protein of unknown function (DUF1706)
VAHVNYYEQWLVGYLGAALRNEKPAPSVETAGMDMDRRNAWIYEKIRNRPVRDVLDETSQVFAQLLETVQALPERDLLDPNRFEWTEGVPLWEAIPGDNYEHYADHEASIRGWLRKF